MSITFVTQAWAGSDLVVAAWSPELDAGVWITGHPNRGQVQHSFDADPVAAIAFMGHPEPPSLLRAARWVHPPSDKLLAFAGLGPLLHAAAVEGAASIRLDRERTVDVLAAATDPDLHHALCLRDADCGRGWTDHAWLWARLPGATPDEVFHLNLNSGQIVPPTPLLLS